jgi:hypothetical protein
MPAEDPWTKTRFASYQHPVKGARAKIAVKLALASRKRWENAQGFVKAKVIPGTIRGPTQMYRLAVRVRDVQRRAGEGPVSCLGMPRSHQRVMSQHLGAGPALQRARDRRHYASKSYTEQ